MACQSRKELGKLLVSSLHGRRFFSIFQTRGEIEQTSAPRASKKWGEVGSGWAKQGGEGRAGLAGVISFLSRAFENKRLTLSLLVSCCVRFPLFLVKAHVGNPYLCVRVHLSYGRHFCFQRFVQWRMSNKRGGFCQTISQLEKRKHWTTTCHLTY